MTTSPVPVDIVEAFLAQAEKNSDVAAVRHRDAETTYRELAVLTRKTAMALRSAGLERPKVVIATEPSPFAYAGMLGTLLSAGTFCPLDTRGPDRRNAAIVGEFGPDAILCDPTFNVGPPIGTKCVSISERDLEGPDLIGQGGTKPNDAAYVVFTSGSTGTPKGVCIGRTGFSHFVQVAQDYFQTRPGERWAQFSNLGYDLAVMDVFLALCHGATLVTFSSDSDELFPAQAIKKHQVHIWQSVPSVLELMSAAGDLRSGLASLRVMSFCGEPLLSRYLAILFEANPTMVVFNTYGATETTGFNTLCCLTGDNYYSALDGAVVPLGREVPGWTVSLKGGSSSSEGEIVVCGDHLSLGYWQDPEMTASRFKQLRSGQRGLRAYFTGDLGLREGDQLHFKGRIDRQVKVKGERVELDEIDFHLRSFGFHVAASILDRSQIYSFVECNEPLDETTVREFLLARLPPHSVPSRVIALDKIPRNQNGKIAFRDLIQTWGA